MLPGKVADGRASVWGWPLIAFLFLYSLTLPSLKLSLGVEFRLGQLTLLAVFVIVLLHDMQLRRVRWDVLLGLSAFGALLAAISFSSPYPKIGELPFLIKYTFIYPPAFYLGLRLPALLTPKQLIYVLEITLFVSCVVAIFLHYFPIPVLIHERAEHLSIALKGSFWEQGHFAFFIGMFLIASLSLRAIASVWSNRVWLTMVCTLALGCGLAAASRTLWLGLILAVVFAGFFYRGDFGSMNPLQRAVLKRAAKRWTKRLVIVAVFMITAIGLFNAAVQEGPYKLFTQKNLENKWENERGAAFRAAVTLIAEDPLLGKGFGYVPYYFSAVEPNVVGLGEDTGKIFNCFLDIWLAAGIFGLLYLVGLHVIGFDRRSLLSVLMISYLFVCANFNPQAQTEEYFVFLGLAYWGALSARKGLHLRTMRTGDDARALSEGGADLTRSFMPHERWKSHVG